MTIVNFYRVLRRALHTCKNGRSFIKPRSDFRHAALCERMRVHRNGSVLSLLVITPSPHQRTKRDLKALANLLSNRIRLTDTAGWLGRSRIGILLPIPPHLAPGSLRAIFVTIFRRAIEGRTARSSSTPKLG